jgi:biopolymer transport protein ExbB/TolQ
MHVSLPELWMAMGPLAKLVVALLLIMSLVAVATAVERTVTVRATRRALPAFEPEWRAVLTGGGLGRPETREAFDRLVRRHLLETGAGLRRRLGLLATIGSTAPFVGLVGTVIGVVNAFGELAAGGQPGLGSMSGGIAEALVTTAIGIAVAIPAVWCFNALTQQIGRVLVELECRAQALAVAALHGERP